MRLEKSGRIFLQVVTPLRAIGSKKPNIYTTSANNMVTILLCERVGTDA